MCIYNTVQSSYKSYVSLKSWNSLLIVFQIAKTLWSTSIRHQSNTCMLDQYPIDVDPRASAIWVAHRGGICHVFCKYKCDLCSTSVIIVLKMILCYTKLYHNKTWLHNETQRIVFFPKYCLYHEVPQTVKMPLKLYNKIFGCKSHWSNLGHIFQCKNINLTSSSHINTIPWSRKSILDSGEWQCLHEIYVSENPFICLYKAIYFVTQATRKILNESPKHPQGTDDTIKIKQTKQTN